MKNKFKYLVKSSLTKKIDTKTFRIVNILIAVLVIGLINIDSIITFFGGDFNNQYHYYVIDELNIYDNFKVQLDTTYKLLDTNSEDALVEKYEDTLENLETVLKEDDNNIALKFSKDENDDFKVEIISNNKIDTIEYQVLLNSINSTKTNYSILELGLTNEEIEKLNSTPIIERIIYSEEKSVDENQELLLTTVFPIVILPFFLLTVFLIQMIGAEINDEKTTKGMEIIISNVSPKVHFFSKVVAGNLFVLIQTILIFVYGGIGFTIRKIIGGDGITNGVFSEISKMADQVLNSPLKDKLLIIIPITLVLMILTFIVYSLVAGILASITTNQEDFQQLQTPLIIVLLVGYYLSIMAGVFKGAIFIKVLSVLPFISAILSPCLLIMGQIGIFEILLAIILTVITIFLLIKYGLRAYKVGILNYSSTGLWKKMFKAMKQKQ